MRKACVVLAIGLVAACASAPPPPPPAPRLEAPQPPIPKETYLKGHVVCEVREAFQGTAALEPGLLWLVDGAIHNRGNRTITWIEVEFSVSASGKKYRHVVLDPVQGHDELPPGRTHEIAFPVCRLEDGIAGDYDPNQSVYPPPQVTARVTDVRFSE